jgi:L-threonylcarbamoyladenylate synthase
MPTTKIIRFTAEDPNPGGIKDAVAVLRSGGLVAFPTETVYGLGADALNADAVQKVFEAKGRPSDNPLIVHVASLEIAWHFMREISDKGLNLAKRFWPGPLTLIAKRKSIVPDIVTAGLDTVAIRIPNHPVSLGLLKYFEGGIVGPSANISGRPSPTSAEHVYHDLSGKIDVILDAGPTAIGMESTVIDVTIDPPAILRIGGLNREDIEKEIGKTRRTNVQEILQRSPGTRHRHYAPKARVILVQKNDREAYAKQMELLLNEGNKIGAISYSEDLSAGGTTKFHLILSSSVELYAQKLFHALRELDSYDLDCIIVESVEEKGIGDAVMDRLRKAAENI